MARKRTELLEKELKQRHADGAISELEAKEVLRGARKELRVELQAKVDRIYERQENYRKQLAVKKKEEKKRIGEEPELSDELIV